VQEAHQEAHQEQWTVAADLELFVELGEQSQRAEVPGEWIQVPV